MREVGEDQEKESKTAVSDSRAGRWFERAGDCLTEMYNRLSGKLLTTLEVALPTGRQLEALKSRVRDIQGETWDVLHDRKHQQFANWFSVVKDETQRPEIGAKQFKAEVAKFREDLAQMIIEELVDLEKIVVNLVGLAMEDEERKEALQVEMARLIVTASHELRRWLSHGINDVLLEIK